MQQPTGGQTITCPCGHPTVVYPPTPDYVDILLQECPQGDSIRRFFDCDNCHERNYYYWDKRHVIIESQKYYTDQERTRRFRPSGFADF